jgi:hypothetical protein
MKVFNQIKAMPQHARLSRCSASAWNITAAIWHSVTLHVRRSFHHSQRDRSRATIPLRARAAIANAALCLHG